MKSLLRLIRQQWRWWHIGRHETVLPEPPKRNSYPPLAWDSPRRQARMFAALEARGLEGTGPVHQSLSAYRRSQLKVVRTA